MKRPSSHPNTSEERCHCYEGWIAQYLLLGIVPFQALAVRVLVLEAGSFPETSWVLRDSGPLPQPWHLNAVAGYVPLFHAVLLSWGACWGLLTLAGPLAHLWLLLTLSTRASQSKSQKPGSSPCILMGSPQPPRHHPVGTPCCR